MNNFNLEFSARPREQYKDKKKERQNYASHDCRVDDDGEKVSGETCPLAQRQASVPVAFDFVSPPSESGTSCQERGGSVITPRDVTSRYSGISVQQARTVRGVKVAITLQQPDWISVGACQLATAELKRYDRMREIKARADDSEHFGNYLKNIKQQLHDAHDHTVCLGRLHQRGRRSAWLYDTLMVASMHDDTVKSVMLYLEGEEYVIELDNTLTDLQQKFYHNQGIHGSIASARRVPKLDDLPLVKFGGL
jgi:hypothetical protein